jgi:hypothetical protein
MYRGLLFCCIRHIPLGFGPAITPRILRLGDDTSTCWLLSLDEMKATLLGFLRGDHS